MREVETPRKRASLLGGARVGEQGAVALSLLVLAGRLPVATFGVVSLIYAYQSFAVTASDYGLGLSLLRTPADRRLCRRWLRAGRRSNLALLAAAGVGAAGLALADRGGDAWMLLAGAVLWGSSAEAYIRKSAALRVGQEQRVACSELAGSLLLLAGVVALGDGDHAALVVALGFVGKSVLETIVNARAIRMSFDDDEGEQVTPGWVWASQLLSFVTANVDYIVVQVLLGSRALGLYSLAFRFAGLVPSQISYVVVRVSTVDLARLHPADHAAAVRRLVRLLFGVGLAIAAGGALLSPLLGVVLGRRWEDATPLILILLVAVPWRMLLSVAGVSALVRDEVRPLSQFEVGRLLVVLLSLVVGAQIGLAWCAAFGAGAAVVSALAAHVSPVLRPAGPAPRWLTPAAVASLVALVAAAALVG